MQTIILISHFLHKEIKLNSPQLYNSSTSMNEKTLTFFQALKHHTYPQLAIALAVFSGSMGSGGAGFLLVLTAQNRQPRVQVSPRSMIVAVTTPSPPPFQHSPMLGHCASSQTVFRLSRESDSFTCSYLSPCGALCLSHPGFFTLGSLPV
jgi:hypothetical protein